jgi:hypothetical protein
MSEKRIYFKLSKSELPQPVEIEDGSEMVHLFRFTNSTYEDEFHEKN